MSVGSVKELRRYPVKSMDGEILEEVRIGRKGLIGDRAWAVRDESRGGIRGAKQIPGLMKLSASYIDSEEDPLNRVKISTSEGVSFYSDDTDINQLVSDAVEHPVSFWPLLPEDALDHYRRGAPIHDTMEEEMRAVFGLTEEESLPDFTEFPKELFEYETPPGTYFDAFPLLLLSENSLKSMQRRWPHSRFDVRRFRPNILVNCADSTSPFPEHKWVGKKIRVGGCVFSIKMECRRCIMVTHAFSDLSKDPKIMRALVKETGGNLGVYATIEQEGQIKKGDKIELLD